MAIPFLGRKLAGYLPQALITGRLPISTVFPRIARLHDQAPSRPLPRVEEVGLEEEDPAPIVEEVDSISVSAPDTQAIRLRSAVSQEQEESVLDIQPIKRSTIKKIGLFSLSFFLGFFLIFPGVLHYKHWTNQMKLTDQAKTEIHERYAPFSNDRGEISSIEKKAQALSLSQKKVIGENQAKEIYINEINKLTRSFSICKTFKISLESNKDKISLESLKNIYSELRSFLIEKDRKLFITAMLEGLVDHLQREQKIDTKEKLFEIIKEKSLIKIKENYLKDFKKDIIEAVIQFIDLEIYHSSLTDKMDCLYSLSNPKFFNHNFRLCIQKFIFEGYQHPGYPLEESKKLRLQLLQYLFLDATSFFSYWNQNMRQFLKENNIVEAMDCSSARSELNAMFCDIDAESESPYLMQYILNTVNLSGVSETEDPLDQVKASVESITLSEYMHAIFSIEKENMPVERESINLSTYYELILGVTYCNARLEENGFYKRFNQTLTRIQVEKQKIQESGSNQEIIKILDLVYQHLIEAKKRVALVAIKYLFENGKNQVKDFSCDGFKAYLQQIVNQFNAQESIDSVPAWTEVKLDAVVASCLCQYDYGFMLDQIIEGDAFIIGNEHGGLNDFESFKKFVETDSNGQWKKIKFV